jgi:signal transduction histidine kinase
LTGKEKSTAIAYRIISDCYERLGSYDSSFVYLKFATLLNDKLEKAEKKKIQEFQIAGFEETLKNQELEKEKIQTQHDIRTYGMLGGLFILTVIGFILYRNNQKEKKAKNQLQEKNHIIEKTLTELKTTQAQLIQSEKLASLGELTAGIAHEIQNPLNFVNNFAEVSAEMLEELEEELDKGDTQEVKAIAADLKQNLSKINHHGKRAASIVRGMLEHSRTSTGVKEPTDLNALADEYLRLAYHGLRAKDSSFNATMETHFDPDLPHLEVVPQDIGRVILNLINNAFYAVAERSRSTVTEKAKQGIEGYHPTVTVSSSIVGDKVEISVKDNGNGIPETIKDKIFQPFFTTKPTGQGTGLGLSLAYDIVTKGHGGNLAVESTPGSGTSFVIQFPINEANL